MTERTIELIIRDLKIVLERGHTLIPVNHRDLRKLIEAIEAHTSRKR